MKYLRYLRSFFSILGTGNWYVGIDKPTFWQWLYAWRIGFKTAHDVCKIHLD